MKRLINKAIILTLIGLPVFVQPMDVHGAEDILQEIEEIKDQQNVKKEEIKQLDNKLSSISKEMRQKNNVIRELEEVKSELEEDIEYIKTKIEINVDRIKKNARTLQEHGGQLGLVQLVFDSNGFYDFLARTYATNKFLNVKTELVKDLEKQQRLLEEKQLSLENTIKQTKKAKEELEELTEDLNEQIKEKKKILKKLNNKKKKLMQEYEKKKLDEQNYKGPIKEGYFIKPAPGKVSSEFGHRIHPIFNTNDLHAGIDIANADIEVPIVAAADGKVIRSYYSNSYGNVVFLSHKIEGKQFTTVYAHMESLILKEGETVKQGQLVGYMGLTGNTTGQHLHFEIHEGAWNPSHSNAVNPRKYIKF